MTSKTFVRMPAASILCRQHTAQHKSDAGRPTRVGGSTDSESGGAPEKGAFEKELDGAVRRDPDDATGHRVRGIFLYFRDRNSEALAAFDEAVRLEPDNAQGHMGRGNALYQ